MDLDLKTVLGLAVCSLYLDIKDYISYNIFKKEYEPTSFLKDGKVIGYQPPTIDDHLSEYNNVIGR